MSVPARRPGDPAVPFRIERPAEIQLVISSTPRPPAVRRALVDIPGVLVMERPARIVAMWIGRHEAHLTVDGPGGHDLVVRLDDVLERLLNARARHLIVDVHRLTGDDSAVLELLAATCHRVWARQGTVEVNGLRDRLVSRPEVRAFPELFGHVAVTVRRAGTSPARGREPAPTFVGAVATIDPRDGR